MEAHSRLRWDDLIMYDADPYMPMLESPTIQVPTLQQSLPQVPASCGTITLLPLVTLMQTSRPAIRAYDRINLCSSVSPVKVSRPEHSWVE
jgi:hypothetical protein